ncbi:MAG: type I secretion system permease/ATPase, partial [Gammaproteobacteria bacterium]|nr:type I secretion system permease/ATPase [Gammaproteobacteria bacterium]
MSETALKLDLETESSTPDPLVVCLLMLARQHDLPASEFAVTSGLPLEGGRLSPSMFDRAARRVGLRAQVVQRDLTALDGLVTPAVLLLSDDRAGVLLRPVSEGEARMLLPENPEAEIRLGVDELEGLYSGYAILASPAHRYDARTPVSDDDVVEGHWFWGTLRSSWRLYRDVALASVLINLFAVASPLFVMNVYDRVVPNQALETLWVLAIGVGVIFGFDFVLRGLRG